MAVSDRWVRENAADKNESDLSDRKKDILEAALLTLTEEGYGRFTMRGVAARANIHLKSLQYHFGTKRELIKHMVDYGFVDFDLANFSMIFDERQAVTARQQLVEAIDWIMRDIHTNPRTSRFYFEIYAMSMRDEDTAEAVLHIYDVYRRGFQNLLLRINPTLDEDVAYRRGAIIASITEGIQIYIAQGKVLYDDFEQLVQETQQRVLDIALAA